MAFLAPWMLLGCLAAAIPVILHLIHRNRPAPIQWAAMDFLLQSIRETRSASRLRDLILLVCRMLVLVLAALAIARPLANRFLSGGPVDLALLIDSSGSMRTTETSAQGPVTRFQLALLEAERIVRNLSGGSRVRLLPFGDRVNRNAVPAGLEPALAIEAIRALKPTDLPTRLDPPLEEAADLLAGADGVNRHMWIISDAPAANWSAAAPTFSGLVSRLPGLGIGWSRIGSAPINHVQVIECAPESGLVLANTRQAWRIRLRNSGPTPARSLVVRLSLGRHQAGPDAQAHLDEASLPELRPGEDHFMHLEALLPEGRQAVVASVVREGERYPADSTLARVVEAKAPRRILIVEKTPSTETAEGRGFFLEQAMHALAGDTGPGNGAPPLEVLRRGMADPVFADLDSMDLVFLVGIAPIELRDEQAKELRRWTSGGKLLVAWGPFDTRDIAPDTDWGAQFTGSRPARVLPNPLFADASGARGLLAPFTLPPLDKVGRVNLRSLPQPGDDPPGVEVLLRASSGEPLVTSATCGRGEVIRVDIGLGPDESDLAISPVFPPMVAILSSRAGEISTAGLNFTAGSGPSPGTLDLGYGRLLRSGESTQSAEAPAWDQAGVWRLEENNIPVRDAVWAVRGGPNEGDDLGPAPAEKARECAGGSLHVVEVDGRGESSGGDLGQGELAWWLALVALSLLVVEGLVARWAGGSL
jgi:hypothetical protein